MASSSERFCLRLLFQHIITSRNKQHGNWLEEQYWPLTPVKIAASKFSPARILHLQKLLHPNFHLQESAKSQNFQDICCTGAPPPGKKIKELTEKNYLLKPKAQDWCKSWTSLASKGYHGSWQSHWNLSRTFQNPFYNCILWVAGHKNVFRVCETQQRSL